MSPRHPFRLYGGPAGRTGTLRALARLAVLAPIGLTSALLAAEGDGPATPTRPAASRPDRTAKSVVVLPFTAVTKDAETNKVVDGVQPGLVSELSSTGTVRATAGQESASDAREAADKVRSSGAAYVVLGTVQSVNGQVRISGQLVDTQTGRTVAPLKATGPANDFFAVQDDVARQAQAALGVTPAGSVGGGRAGSPANRAAGAATADSHWAGYEDFYQAARSAPSAGSYPPPTPPPPPLYGAGFGGGGYGYGGGGYYDGFGFPFSNSGPVVGDGFQSGNVSNGRGFVLGSAGVSNAPPPPTAFNPVRTVAAGSFLPNAAPPTQIPPFNRPVQSYRSRFLPSPVGQPQRAAPPNLRPGAPAAPAAARPTG